VLPHRQASAHPLALAVPAGITIGAGAYTTGAWALAATLGGLGYVQNEEAINAHALKIWNASNQLSQDSMNWMVGQSLTLGKGAVSFGKDFVDWWHDAIPSMAMNSVDPSLTSKYSSALETFMVQHAKLSTATGSSYNVQLRTPAYSVPWLIVGGLRAKSVAIGYNQPNKESYLVIELETGFSKVLKSIDGPVGMAPTQNVKEFINYAANVWGISITPFVPTFDLPATYPDVLRGYNDAWRGMKDAGLVLPVEDAIPSINGQSLRYNPSADTYTFPSGEVFDGSPGDLTWTFPRPRVVTDTATGNPVVAIPTTKPAVDGSIPHVRTGTWTNVFTNTTITSDLDVPIEGEIPVPPVKPDLSKPTKKISFAPLILVGNTLKDKFPFSIPFDFLKQLGIFDVAPEAPKIAVNMPVDLPGGIHLPAEFAIDFKMFDKVAVMGRWFSVIIFDVGLILAIRRFMPE